MRSEDYCIGLCVCLLTNLTYGAFARPENAVTYSAGNEGQGICLKRLRLRVMQRNTSEKANMLLFRLTRGQLSQLHAQQRSARGYPMILNNIQLCPKMPTDAASPCWSENLQHHAFITATTRGVANFCARALALYAGAPRSRARGVW